MVKLMNLNFQLVWACDAKFTMRVPPGLHPDSPGFPTPLVASTRPHLLGKPCYSHWPTALEMPVAPCLCGLHPVHVLAAADALEKGPRSPMLPLKHPAWLETACSIMKRRTGAQTHWVNSLTPTSSGN